ncbi:MAG: S8 family serine peptidase [Pyrinomonadaceae bacterium]|nr:S8 family serine peptidase [Pyrinomonadaceae bacterium]
MPRPEKRLNQRMRLPLSRLSFITLLVLTLAGAIFLQPYSFEPASAQQQPDGAKQLSQNALGQIAAFYEEKTQRTPAQRKIDSQLLATLRMSRGEDVARGIRTIETGVELDREGKTLLDIDATVTDKLLDSIRKMGGDIVSSFPQFRAIRTRFPLAQLEALAALPDVKFINREFKSITHSSARRSEQRQAATPLNHRTDFSMRAANVRAQLPGALSGLATTNTVAPQEMTPDTGSVTSQGDVTHRAAAARTTFAATGAGVKIGVLSDSDDFREASQASGDLPPVVTVLPGQNGRPGIGEGTAMMEIVHDLAPGAQIFFATGFGGPASFSQNILDLRAAGCDIIVDDVFNFAAPTFQDGVIAQAVNTVTAQGALFFSSAGNAGNLNDGQSGVWEGDFADGGPFTFNGQTLGNIHLFNGFNNNLVINGGGFKRVDLFWSDAFGASANDYDVFVFNNAGNAILRSATNPQTGTEDPYESIGTLNVGERIVIVKFSGAARFIHVNTGRGRLNFGTAGQTRGQSAAVNAFSVASVDVATSFPNAYVGGAQNPVETASSDGPRRIFYNANGTAITPGNFSSTGGTVRQKPDIAAADGNVTTLPPGSGLNPFFGTSAAAPHAAAIAGLIKSYRPSLTPAQIRATLLNTALDIEAPGVDRDSGAGIVMAFQALQSLGPNNQRKPFDFDGDGKTDVAVFRPTGGNWYILQSSNNAVAGQPFGFGTDRIVPGDYDGDGRADIAVFRNGTWYLQRSMLGFTGVQFGVSGDVPVPGDYDGDGKFDVAVFRTGTWYILQSATGALRAEQFGSSTDKPVVGDFDGDGRADLAVFRNGTWYLQQSTQGFVGVNFGSAGDRTVPGDYDGDGKTDIAVFRNGTWYLQRSQLGFTGVQFGASGDIPTPGDYDGDGKTDIAVYRGGTWYLLRSQLGFTGVQFGASGDVPTPSAFVQ